jgi:ribonuclease BN (tRNA processing enzyme)
MAARLTFAGAGSAFTTDADNFQSNMVIETPQGRLLIDCGGDARHSTKALGLAPRDLGAVYISHLHADHIGGLEWLAFTTYFDPTCAKPRLILPAALRGPLWDNGLSAGLGIIDTGRATLDSYFDVTPVAERGAFSWGGLEFRTIPADHVVSGGMVMVSHGLLFTVGKQTVYITTDAIFDGRLQNRPYDQADLVFHDCETGPRSGVHAHYHDLCGLPAALKKKIWLYHYNPGPLPDAVADGFRGFVRRGQSFELGAS